MGIFLDLLLFFSGTFIGLKIGYKKGVNDMADAAKDLFKKS